MERRIRATAFIACSLTGLMLGSSFSVMAKDLGPDQALKLRDAGTIKPFDALNQSALTRHLNSKVVDSELEQEYGRYIYQVELIDAKGTHWELEFDAATGELLRDYQDQ